MNVTVDGPYTSATWSAAQQSVETLIAAELKTYSEAESYGVVVTHIARTITAAYHAAARAMCSACAERVPLLATTTPAVHQDDNRQYTCTAWPIWELLAEEARDG